MLKRDFILKLNLSNINFKVHRRSTGDFFLIKIGSLVKEAKDYVEPVVNMLSLNSLEMFFSSNPLNDARKEYKLLSIPLIEVKKRYDPNEILSEVATKARNNLGDSKVSHSGSKLDNAIDPKDLLRRKVSGFKLQDRLFYELVYNFSLLIKVKDMSLSLPYEIEIIT